MTQDKMRRMITACVSAATVLLVFLLGFLIYQWIAISNNNSKIEGVERDIANLNAQIEANKETEDFLNSDVGLQFQLSELEQKKENLQGK